MSDKTFSASANVRITIEVRDLGPYGADWPASKIHDQVAREATDTVRRLMSSCHNCGADRRVMAVIVGEPEVEIVSQRKGRP